MIQLKKIQAWEARHEAGLISGFQDVLMEKMMTDSWPKKKRDSNGNTRKKMAEVKAAAAAGFDTAKAAAQ
ncbi:hypothetical protein Peur_011829 [Populus x canadensis]